MNAGRTIFSQLMDVLPLADFPPAIHYAFNKPAILPQTPTKRPDS